MRWPSVYLICFREETEPNTLNLKDVPVTVVGPVTEIKTGYQGFQTNEIQYFVCLLLALIISRRAYMNQNLQLEMDFARY